MKRFISALLSIMLVIGVCALPAAAEQTTSALKILATTYPLYDMAKNVMGDMAEVVYSAEYVEDCNVVLCTGGVNDAWADELEGVTVVKAIDSAELMDLSGNPVTEDTAPENIDTDVIVVPINLVMCSFAFIDALSVLDGTNATTYYLNQTLYIEQLILLDNRIREVANAQLITGGDGSMAYFALEFGLTCAQEGEEAIVLYTFNQPEGEDAELTYIELFERNIAALSGGITEGETQPAA